ncbi:oligosaccharide flippase family protein [Alcaligenaceae bacterium CGII-47]|nr:oligosaccharide flippase family protein [Alcaligenaceae bacterium CGII-47]
MGVHSTGQVVARNAGALYAVQLVSYLVPIFEIPILARALGAEQYGTILFCQALALTCSLLVEYGFNINAAQQVAVAHERPAELNKLFSQVILAKVLLAAPIIALLSTSWLVGWADLYLGHAGLLVFVLAYFFAFGFSPMWYFQGLERMAGPALLDVILRLGGLGLLAVWVRTPQDFYLALPLLAIPPLLNTGLTTWWCRREVGAVGWDVKGAWWQIREGFHFFIYRSASNLVMSAVPVFLGLSSGKRAVGEFAPPEKLVKGMTSLAMPFLMAVFPLFSRRLAAHNASISFRGPVLLIAMIGMLALLGTGLGVWLGPWALGLLLGNGFPGSLLIYYVLIGLVPLRIVNQSIALILLIPAGHAKSVSYVISASSILAVLLGAGLAIPYGGLGMAAGLLGVEAILLLALGIMMLRVIRDDK